MSRGTATWIAALAAAAGGATGCGNGSPPPMSLLCVQSAPPIVQALARAPAPVRLRDGTRLSDCVARAQSEADIENFGVLITRLADDLADRARHDPQQATELGYLIGAARRGAAKTNGTSLELEHRLESAVRRAGLVSATVTRALDRGLAAGERTG